jgi:hypothetical protein
MPRSIIASSAAVATVFKKYFQGNCLFSRRIRSFCNSLRPEQQPVSFNPKYHLYFFQKLLMLTQTLELCSVLSSLLYISIILVHHTIKSLTLSPIIIAGILPHLLTVKPGSVSGLASYSSQK